MPDRHRWEIQAADAEGRQDSMPNIQIFRLYMFATYEAPLPLRMALLQMV
jgi:hypothetical protein